MAVGLALAVVVGLTSAPAWAVTLGGMGVAQAITFALLDGRTVPTGSRPAGTGTAVFWTLVFVAVSVGGALLWLLPGVRATLGASRTPDAGPYAVDTLK